MRNDQHQKLVRWNVELRIKDGGTGLIPQYLLVHASYAASWFQPLCTMAKARNISEHMISIEDVIFVENKDLIIEEER